MRFSFMKLAKLYGVSLYCAAVICIVNAVFGYGDGCLKYIWDVAVGQWYLNAYAILMCLAPILNEGCRSIAEKFKADRKVGVMMVLPMIFCAFGWSFSTTLPIVRDYVPRATGLSSYSFLTLLGAYCVARFWRGCENSGMKPRFPTIIVLCILAVSLGAAAIGLNDYNSPFALAIAASTFYLARNASFPAAIGKACVWLGPSMFSVYLLHSSGRTWWALAKCEDILLGIGMPIIAVWGVTAIIVFSVCVVLDLPRRLFAGLLTQRSRGV